MNRAGGTVRRPATTVTPIGRARTDGYNGVASSDRVKGLATMISLWAVVRESDVEAYASTLVLPPYLSHLHLEPFSFRAQATNRDGHEPLELSYRGEGRLEHYRLLPEDHALGLVCAVCPGINTSRIHLPRDDARWHWTAGPHDEPQMRIYFAPTARTLPEMPASHPADDAYVSVSRGHVFLGRRVVEAYTAAWLARLGIESEPPCCQFDTPGGGVDFSAGQVGGQLLLSDRVTAEDLVRFAGLEPALADVRDFVVLDLDEADENPAGPGDEGVYLALRRHEAAGKPAR